jgi:hypothetical protein
MLSAWRNNACTRSPGTTGAAFILVHASVKQWVGAWRRIHMQLISSFLLETYDCVSYMPLVIFVGTTDDPDSDDGLKLAGLASEPLRRGERDAMLTQ